MSVADEGQPDMETAQQQQLKLLEALQRQAFETQYTEYKNQQASVSTTQAASATPTQQAATGAESTLPQEPYTAASLGQLKLSDIKKILKDSGKRVTGNKEDLIARILGVEEPSLLRAHGKRPSDQITEGNGSEGEEDDEEDGPQLKKFKVDKADPLWNICFLCQSTQQLVRYKDMRQCYKCKAYWKGKRMLRDDAQNYFLLVEEDLKTLPYKESTAPGSSETTRMYAFATCAGAALRKFGSLYHMVKSNPQQREELAQQILTERNFAESQKLQSFEANQAHAGENLPPSALPAARQGYAPAAESSNGEKS